MKTPTKSDRQPRCLNGTADPAGDSVDPPSVSDAAYIPSPGPELALLLLQGFRTLVDEARQQLSLAGHPGVRNGHEFAMRAIEAGARDAAALSASLGVSKQAAAKIVAGLEARGYIMRECDRADGRRKPLRLTERGRDLLEKGQVIFDRLRDDWIRRVGEEDMENVEATLRRLVGKPDIRFDTAAWFGSSVDAP